VRFKSVDRRKSSGLLSVVAYEFTISLASIKKGWVVGSIFLSCGYSKWSIFKKLEK